MKSFLCLTMIGIVALAMNGYAQDSKKQPAKAEITKAVYMVPNQHCPVCATALEGSLKKVEGIKSTTVNFPNKLATVDFDESVISAQEVSRAMFQASHAMGANMKYNAFLLLSVPDAKSHVSEGDSRLEKSRGRGECDLLYADKIGCHPVLRKGKGYQRGPDQRAGKGRLEGTPVRRQEMKTSLLWVRH